MALAEKVTGKMNGFTAEKNVTVDGTTYKKSANGIWVGDSAGNFDISGLLVQNNVISNIVASPSTWGGRE